MANTQGPQALTGLNLSLSTISASFPKAKNEDYILERSALWSPVFAFAVQLHRALVMRLRAAQLGRDGAKGIDS